MTSYEFQLQCGWQSALSPTPAPVSDKVSGRGWRLMSGRGGRLVSGRGGRVGRLMNELGGFGVERLPATAPLRVLVQPAEPTDRVTVRVRPCFTTKF